MGLLRLAELGAEPLQLLEVSLTHLLADSALGEQLRFKFLESAAFGGLNRKESLLGVGKLLTTLIGF